MFTKFDARTIQEYNQLPEGMDDDERWELANVNAKRTLENIYVPRVRNTPHPPTRVVYLEGKAKPNLCRTRLKVDLAKDMHKLDKQCPELAEKTAEVITDVGLRRLFVSVQKNNITLCIKEGIKYKFVLSLFLLC